MAGGAKVSFCPFPKSYCVCVIAPEVCGVIFTVNGGQPAESETEKPGFGADITLMLTLVSVAQKPLL